MQNAPVSILPIDTSYDCQSHVLVVSKHEDILKFTKMHLNKYFSHICAVHSYSEAHHEIIKGSFDLIIADSSLANKYFNDFIKKIAITHRYLPILIIDQSKSITPTCFDNIMIVDAICPPFDLDIMHIAIRKSLMIKPKLLALHNQLSPSLGIAKCIREPQLANKESKTARQLIKYIISDLSATILD